MCHVSRVACHMSRVMCHNFFSLFFSPPMRHVPHITCQATLFPPQIIGSMIRNGQEIQCLPYAEFFQPEFREDSAKVDQKSGDISG